MDDMLQPRIVGVSNGRYSVFLPHIFTQSIAAPITDIKRRLGKNEVCFQVSQLVFVKTGCHLKQVTLAKLSTRKNKGRPVHIISHDPPLDGLPIRKEARCNPHWH